jgi:uncharacterized RmlC-like cupin family protein
MSRIQQTLAGLCLVAIAALPATAQERCTEHMIRTPTEDIPYQPLFPAVEAKTLYGGFEKGVATAIIARTDPGEAAAIPHTHTDGYRGFILAGNHQHWQMSEPAEGPVLKPGSSWYRPANVPHADLCVGPEPCETLVIFEQRADFIPARYRAGRPVLSARMFDDVLPIGRGPLHPLQKADTMSEAGSSNFVNHHNRRKFGTPQ